MYAVNLLKIMLQTIYLYLKFPCFNITLVGIEFPHVIPKYVL